MPVLIVRKYYFKPHKLISTSGTALGVTGPQSAPRLRASRVTTALGFFSPAKGPSQCMKKVNWNMA